MFWSEACLKALTERLMSLEINKDDWRGLLADVHARIPELLARRADFLLPLMQTGCMNMMSCSSISSTATL